MRTTAQLLKFLSVSLLLALPSQASADEDPIFFKSEKLASIDGNQFPKRINDTKAGDSITVYFDGCKASAIKFSETERHTRIYEDISALVKKFALKDAAPCRPTPLSQSYQLKYLRSSLKITALDKDGKEVGTETIVIGPKEHLFISLDLPVDNRKTLKYDSGSKSLLPQDTNAHLYWAINYAIGDLLEKPSALSGLDRMEVKAMFLAKSHPLDSYGLAVGYRFSDSSLFGLDLQSISGFVGYFQTKEDKVDNTTPQSGRGKSRAWRFGVSYDLGTALKWVK